MPDGYDYDKEYGPHKYEGHGGTLNCKYGCDCWAGPARSGGPVGLDPLSGECPGNPKDGESVGGSADYEIVVTRRINKLESNLYNAQQRVEELEQIVDSKKGELYKELKKARKELRKKNELLKEIQEKVKKRLES